MDLEDYIEKFAATAHLIGTKHVEFIISIYDQISCGRTLTTRQGYAACAMMRELARQPDFKRFGIDKKAMLAAIDGKKWKTPLRISKERRKEVRYLGDNIVAISAPITPDMKIELRNTKAVWRDEMYIVTVTRNTLTYLIEFIGKYGLEMDSEVEKYLALCLGSKKQVSHFIAVQDGAAINVCDDEALANFVLHICKGKRL